jgi:hypothetical protein
LSWTSIAGADADGLLPDARMGDLQDVTAAFPQTGILLEQARQRHESMHLEKIFV